MSGDTVVNAGTGLIRLDAGGDITLGKLRTTSPQDLVIKSSRVRSRRW
jgi:hypothetical protein